MEAKTYNSDGDIFFGNNAGDYSYLTCYYNNNAVGVCSLLQAARGELAQWDFFKGLTTMFNLITLQDPVNPSNLLIEPYDDVFTVDCFGKRNGSIRIMNAEALRKKRLHVNVGSFMDNCTNIHTIDDLKVAESNFNKSIKKD